jgi:cytochrome c oxidase assembly protein subunit 11
MTDIACGADLLAEQRKNSRATLGKLLLIIPVMLVFCASMVPLYRQICEVMGISASKAVAQNTQIDFSRTVKVEFDGGVNRNFAWQFVPLDKKVEVNPGAVVTINYRVTNRMTHATTGRAVPSIGPVEAGLYFQKLACFCFSNQTLQPGETRDMPVTFFVDPKLPKDIGSIVLSYTFFNVTEEQKS